MGRRRKSEPANSTSNATTKSKDQNNVPPSPQVKDGEPVKEINAKEEPVEDSNAGNIEENSKRNQRTTRSQSRERELVSLPATPKRARRNSRDGSIEKDKKEVTEGVRKSSRRSSVERTLDARVENSDIKLEIIKEEVETPKEPSLIPATVLANIALPSEVIPQKVNKANESNKSKEKVNEISKSLDKNIKGNCKEKESSPQNEETLELEATGIADEWKEDIGFWSDIPLPPNNSNGKCDKLQVDSKKNKNKEDKECEKSISTSRLSISKEVQQNKGDKKDQLQAKKPEKDDIVSHDKKKQTENKLGSLIKVEAAILSPENLKNKSSEVDVLPPSLNKSSTKAKEANVDMPISSQEKTPAKIKHESDKHTSPKQSKKVKTDINQEKERNNISTTKKDEDSKKSVKRQSRHSSGSSRSSHSPTRKVRSRSSSSSSTSSSSSRSRHRSRQKSSRKSSSTNANRSSRDKRAYSKSPRSSRNEERDRRESKKHKPVEFSPRNKSHSRSKSPNLKKDDSPKRRRSDSWSNKDRRSSKVNDKVMESKPEIDYSSFKSSRKVSLSHSKSRDDADQENDKPKRRKWGNDTTSQPSLEISSKSLKTIIPDVEPLSASELHMSHGSSSNSELEEGETASVEGPELPPRDHHLELSEQDKENDILLKGKKRDLQNGRAGVERRLSKREIREMSPIRRRRTSEYSNEDHKRSSRKIYVVEGPVTNSKPSIAPPQNKITKVIYISGLVRPFTIRQLRLLLQRTGKLIEPLWIDQLKSKCLAKYDNEDQALETRMALHGVKWPSTNPKTLYVDFSSEAELSGRLKQSPQATNVPEEPRENRWRRDQPVREWDLAKLGERSPGEKERERERQRREREEERVREKERKETQHVPEVSPVKEEARPKSVDDLFCKTKAQPSIYWLPLTPDQIAEKEAQRRKKMAENERMMAELRAANEKERAEREKMRQEREKKEKERAKEREREREKERERERERERNRKSRSRSRSRRRSRSPKRSPRRSPRRTPRRSPRRSPQRSRRSPSHDSRPRRRTRTRSRSQSRSRT